MALHRTGEKPLPKSMLTQSINAYMQHLGRWVNGLSTIQGGMIYNPIHIYGQWKPTESWWRHQMETFSTLLAICAGNSPVTNEFPAQRPMTLRFDVCFDLPRINVWVNNREAGDLRCYHTHYDVIVMMILSIQLINMLMFSFKIMLLQWHQIP